MVIIGPIQTGYYGTGSDNLTWHDGPDSEGGVGVRFGFRNDQHKTILSAFFTLIPFDKDRKVPCCTRQSPSIARIGTFGLFRCGASRSHDSPSGGYWKHVWFNRSIVGALMAKIELSYCDGSSETLTGSQIRLQTN